MSFIWGSMRALDGADTSSPQQLAGFLRRCVEAGCTGIDLADIYNRGRSEALVGEALKLAPDLCAPLPLIAKSGVVFATSDAERPAHHYRNDALHLREGLEGSLRRLGVEQVDTFLVHRPDYLMAYEETAGLLDEFVSSGKVRRVGVSNFSTARMNALSSALTVSLSHHQLEMSVLEPGALEDGRLDAAQTAGQTVTAWSPLAGGRLFAEGDEAAGRVRDVLSVLAGSSDPDRIAGAALAWVARHPSRPVPILGSTDITRIERQSAAQSEIHMGAESWYAVLEASRRYPVP